ncbi:MAG: DUF4369 domain-containing protein [Flavobacteriales bacterium]|nr:DUF4369 domain-containing protein [Flavobacteriales bacterium]
MKNLFKTVLFCSVLAFFATACNSDKFTINGNITGLEDQKAFLSKPSMTGLEQIDTVECKGGKFTFTGKMDFNDYRIITFENQAGEIDLYIDNSTINVEGDYNDLENVKVTGSEAMDFFKSFIDDNKAMETFRQTQMAAYQAAQQANDTTKITQLAEEFMAKQKEYVLKSFEKAESHPEDLLSFFVAMNNSTYVSPDRLAAFYAQVPEIIKKDERLAQAVTRMDEIVKLSAGKEIPEFSLSDFAGKDSLTKASIAGKNTAMYITTPDVADNEAIFEVLKNVKAKGGNVVLVFMIMSGEQLSFIQQYIKDKGLDQYTVMQGDETFAQSFGALTPRVFLIGADGKFVATAIEKDAVKTEAEKFPVK